MDYKARISERLLPFVRRPGRYAGGELHAILPRKDDFQIALAFPDLYEIGFPYLGFQILYHRLNSIDGISCQRVYAPDIDAETIMRREKIPLCTIEDGNPLKNLDAVGFTLQYELHSTTILNMLELGEVPLRTELRSETCPIVMGGGPLAYSPEPFAPFFDAFLLGDAEDALPAVVKNLRKWKSKGISRTEILSGLAEIPGVYIPSLYRPLYSPGGRFARFQRLNPRLPEKIQAVHQEVLRQDFYPDKPLIPLISVEHDRLALEVMRGCTRGCRFCNAGIIHRPTRERQPDYLIKQLDSALKFTGYDEISLLSLSTADYSALSGLLPEIAGIIEGQGISLSYPSLRPDAFTVEIARSISAGRKTGLTFAPEAGTERLRAVINKDLSDKDLLQALKIAADAGWRSAKLYFMVGLPTETEADVQAIAGLALKCRSILGSDKRKPLHVSLSVFSPKPHTAFQWEPLLSTEEVLSRIGMIKRRLNRSAIKVSYHDPGMTMVETLLARGDRRVADVIERVFRAGARQEGWTENFDFDRWDMAMREENLPWELFTGELNTDDCLAWEIASTGVSPEFFLRERGKSRQAETTPDCRWKCSQCGLECPPPPKPRSYPRSLPKSRPLTAAVSAAYRFKLARSGPSKWMSHLETAKLLERSFRRARMPVAYSLGFHPHPRISFGPALPLGFETAGDCFDVRFHDSVSEPVEKMNLALHGGVKIIEAVEIPLTAVSLGEIIDCLSYEIKIRKVTPELQETIGAWQEGQSVYTTGREGKLWDITSLIRCFELVGETLRFDAAIVQGRSPRPDNLLYGLEYEPGEAEFKRLGCFSIQGDSLIDPLEVA